MWVWDSSQQVLATQGAVYVQGHCLQEQRLYKQLHCLQALGPLQEHTTFRESLVCYTSPPGEVYVLGVLPGVFVIRFVGFRGRSGRASVSSSGAFRAAWGCSGAGCSSKKVFTACCKTALDVVPCAAQAALNCSAVSRLTLQARTTMFSLSHLAYHKIRTVNSTNIHRNTL